MPAENPIDTSTSTSVSRETIPASSTTMTSHGTASRSLTGSASRAANDPANATFIVQPRSIGPLATPGFKALAGVATITPPKHSRRVGTTNQLHAR
jgi:hypothetical protein